MQKNSSNGTSKSSKTGAKGKAAGMQSSQLMELFTDELKDIYWAEKALVKALPKMAKNATAPELVKALESHLKETNEQVSRLEKVFDLIGKKAVGKKCDAMEGLIKEGQSIMEECEEGAMCDAGIISAGQKIEHYEIASYGTLRQFAETLELTSVEKLLAKTLEEEKKADVKLTEVAVTAINIEAAEEVED